MVAEYVPSMVAAPPRFLAWYINIGIDMIYGLNA